MANFTSVPIRPGPVDVRRVVFEKPPLIPNITPVPTAINTDSMGRLLMAAEGEALAIDCRSLSFACSSVGSFPLRFVGFLGLFIISVLSLPVFICVPEARNGDRE
jgi:hypothetical protein